ncbi:MAG: BON domain-containing protein [Acidobacteriaceae bacterium]
MERNLRFSGFLLSLGLAAMVLVSAGCNKKVDDTQLATQVQAQIAADPALQGQMITASAVNGAVTLSGTVNGPGSRELAGNDAAKVPGVRTVVNNLTVQGGDQPQQMGGGQGYANGPAPGGQSYSTMPPPQRSYSNAPASAPAAPQVTTIPAGTRIRVQLAQTLSTKESQTGDQFSGTLADPVVVNGQTVIRAGAQASGTVTEAKSQGRFKGQAILAVRLDSVRADGHTYPVQTSQVERFEQGKGKRTAYMTGGGAGLGALIGGLAGGGKGALIGGLLGAGAGGTGSAFTGNKDLVLPAESILTFRLENDVTLR